MPVPPKPRLVLTLELDSGDVPMASWQLPDDTAVDVTAGIPGVDNAVQWMQVWAPQEAPVPPPPIMPSPDSLFFAAQSVGSTTTTRFLPIGYDTTEAPTAPLLYELPAGGTLSQMRVLHNQPAGSGDPIVYTVRINGGPTALLVALGSLTPSGSNLVDSVAGLVAGDQLDIQITKALDIVDSPGQVTVSLRFDSVP